MQKCIFQRADIADACGAKAFARGMDYFRRDRVLERNILEAGDGYVHFYATVAGSQIYTQDIAVNYFPEFGEIDLDGDCSCPVGFNCKHVVAACLDYLEGIGESAAMKSSDQQVGQLDLWLGELVSATEASQAYLAPSNEDFLVYLLQPDESRSALSSLYVEIRATHPRKKGRGLVKGVQVSPDSVVSNHRYSSQRWRLQTVDHDIARFLTALDDKYYYYKSTQLSGRIGGLALASMVQTRRCYWLNGDAAALTEGENRKLILAWQQEKRDSEHSLDISIQPQATLLATEPPMYLDSELGEIGIVDCGDLNTALLKSLVDAPPVPDKLAKQLSLNLLQHLPGFDIPLPAKINLRENSGKNLHPRITLRLNSNAQQSFHSLSLEFDYDGDRVMPLPQSDSVLITNAEPAVRVWRDIESEKRIIEQLFELGFTPVDMQGDQTRPVDFYAVGDSVVESAAVWACFLEQRFDELRAQGWHIERDESFELSFSAGDWEVAVEDDGENVNDWFGLRFDLNVDGQQLPLAPLIASILEQDPETLPETLTLPLEGHHYVRLPSERIRPFLNTLRELFERAPADRDGIIRLSRFDATVIDELGDDQRRIKGAKHLRKLSAKLRDFSGIKKVAVPRGFGTTLRNYQRDGLNWLQFLREYSFNGILADDMGLGKTVQTLANLLVEKRSGRQSGPTLIVAPTSLMGNWRREAEKFTPDLSVIVLHGHDRKQRFAEIQFSDIVLTTYPLLLRDAEALLDHQYHYVVLDEAQAIKNAKSKMSAIVREFKSQHRLCLTGTPLENHLGELWSLFDFLMPGLLGNNTQFTRSYRTPIEKHGSSEQGQSLARRVQPFLLRREKNAVAAELPAKTEILHSVELGREQAQLYESIRVSMDKRVREVINKQGLARSHITILDALLKLRQVCCDPRLTKLAGGQQVKHSAKLEWLMTLLPEQLEEGRRILLFSQFTSMLSLIEKELVKLDIAYTKLTGQTRKRDEAIQRFSQGEVNLFLISLKAGGTGLNLTEADTVIIYDPWWNPAVESQAIDRAHRIGQDKPVFVYKLVTANSIEERMLAMQARKRALADGVYSNKSDGEASLLNTDILKELFAPLS
ncbi:MAG: DEAD/DEAH box helicase [Gammaproteobacteria bacterium]|nr:DEAD/DEAH box helicase [Gammaproteobacteria bacterium]